MYSMWLRYNMYFSVLFNVFGIWRLLLFVDICYSLMYILLVVYEYKIINAAL